VNEVRRPALRIGTMLALFVGLTLLGIWWAAPDMASLRRSWRDFLGLSWTMLLLLAVLSIGLIGAEMVRTIIFGRALGVKIGFRTSLDTTIADNFFSWLTPAALAGDPASLYMLRRSGVPWDAATIIVFGEFATGFAFIMGLGGLLLALGHGPAIVPWAGLSLAAAGGCVSLLLCALIAGAFWPVAVTSVIDRSAEKLSQIRFLSRPLPHRALEAVAREARGAVQRLARFRRAGAPGWLAILASHVLYYGTFVGILVVLAAAFDVRSWLEVVPTAIIYQGFLYLAPTPGAAGVGEASATLFFGNVLPGGRAFAVVMLFRMLTFYLHVLIGLVYLPFIGVLGEILRLGRTKPSGEVD
jgi:uncharacterized protein (TIRG00374 family)